MIRYSIKDLGEISGIKPHTIRIWEQRYNLLTPDRTDTNIREYDDEQLKKLLNVCELINRGQKISRISKLTSDQISSEIEKIIDASFKGNAHFESIINQAIIAISTFDETRFEGLLNKCLDEFGMVDTYLKFIYPMLVKIGLMWGKGDIMPAQEHFLSNLVKRKLFSAIDSLPLPINTNQTWLLFLGEQEEHEIGLLFANFILRQNNKRVLYLGSNVPYENIAEVVKQCKPTHLYTFFVRRQTNEELDTYIKMLLSDFKKTKVCMSGKEELVGQIATDNKVKWIKDIDMLIEMVKN